MAGDKTPRVFLPAEIQFMIIDALLQDGCSVASFATVSREWQVIVERHNFARINLTTSRLADVDSMLRRNRHLVGYLWFRVELERYDCTKCAPSHDWLGSNMDNVCVATAIQDLFSTLSTWEPNGDLLLDISVYSPSDSEHWFKYLTFGPDTPSDQCSWKEIAGQAMLATLVDGRHQHGWYATCRSHHRAPIEYAIKKVFVEIMGEGPFDTDEQEGQWWRQLPLVPAVTGVLLRQQNRRRWKAAALAQMFSRFPSLREIQYEPWREWDI
ncbi:hypothetical protein VMCG_00510 [Cytospora schulzeri]|uniref:F-box domain-containing protein n=1 Tax=Cytospora schulzeri TaxID=448051 RepID=A0A423X9A8_9PEZI|nr:hypothetical protein VMCG_00510 [Valsa malicola]